MRYLFLSLAAILGTILFSNYASLPDDSTSLALSADSAEAKTIPSGFGAVQPELDRLADLRTQRELLGEKVALGITSHHLPTALPLIFNFYDHLLSTAGPRQTFVIIAPDHLESCPALASTTSRDYATPYGRIEIDRELLSTLKKAGVADGDTCFTGDHSVGVPAFFISKFFPEAKILPIVLSSAIDSGAEERILQALAAERERIFVLASVDFSHHHQSAQAEQLDRGTQEMIERLDGQNLNLDRVDSPAAARIVLTLAQRSTLKPLVIDRKNTFDYSGIDQDVTGYLSVVFFSPES